MLDKDILDNINNWVEKLTPKNKTPCVIDDVVKDVNNLLKKYNIQKRLGLTDLKIWDTYISDLHTGGKLSEIIHEFMAPSFTKMIVYHYCPFETACSIFNTNNLRLYNIQKRFTTKENSEYRMFYESHNYQGYKIPQTAFGTIIDSKDIIDNVFYTSFSDKYDIPNLWQNFSDSRKGVCIEFELNVKSAEFRKIKYSKLKKRGKHFQFPLIGEIRDAFKKYNRELIFEDLSVISSYYLWCKYKKQREFRLLVNGYGAKANSVKPFLKTDHTGRYLEIPLSNTLFFNLECKRIILGRYAGLKRKQILNKYLKPIFLESKDGLTKL